MQRSLLALLLGALAGCAAPPPQQPADTLAGHLVMAPRMQVFIGCQAEEPLWVVAVTPSWWMSPAKKPSPGCAVR